MTTNSIYRRGAILFVPEILPLCRYNKAVLLRVCMYCWGNRSRMLSRELPGLLVCSACLINAGFVTVFELSEKCIFCFLESSVSRIYTLLWLCRTFRSLFIMQKKLAHIVYSQRVGVVKRARPCRCKLFVRSEIALRKCVLGQYSAPYILKLKWIALRCRPCANNLTDYAQKLSTKKPLSLKIWRFLARSPQNNAKVIHHLLTLCITFVDNFTPLSVITR